MLIDADHRRAMMRARSHSNLLFPKKGPTVYPQTPPSLLSGFLLCTTLCLYVVLQQACQGRPLLRYLATAQNWYGGFYFTGLLPHKLHAVLIEVMTADDFLRAVSQVSEKLVLVSHFHMFSYSSLGSNLDLFSGQTKARFTHSVSPLSPRYK